MYKRLNELNFVIGLFFTIVAMVLLAGTLFSSELSGSINLYTGAVFLVFGLFMILIKKHKSDSE